MEHFFNGFIKEAYTTRKEREAKAARAKEHNIHETKKEMGKLQDAAKEQKATTTEAQKVAPQANRFTQAWKKIPRWGKIVGGTTLAGGALYGGSKLMSKHD